MTRLSIFLLITSLLAGCSDEEKTESGSSEVLASAGETAGVQAGGNWTYTETRDDIKGDIVIASLSSGGFNLNIRCMNRKIDAYIRGGESFGTKGDFLNVYYRFDEKEAQVSRWYVNNVIFFSNEGILYNVDFQEANKRLRKNALDSFVANTRPMDDAEWFIWNLARTKTLKLAIETEPETRIQFEVGGLRAQVNKVLARCDRLQIPDFEALAAEQLVRERNAQKTQVAIQNTPYGAAHETKTITVPGIAEDLYWSLLVAVGLYDNTYLQWINSEPGSAEQKKARTNQIYSQGNALIEESYEFDINVKSLMVAANEPRTEFYFCFPRTVTSQIGQRTRAQIHLHYPGGAGPCSGRTLLHNEQGWSVYYKLGVGVEVTDGAIADWLSQNMLNDPDLYARMRCGDPAMRGTNMINCHINRYEWYNRNTGQIYVSGKLDGNSWIWRFHGPK